MQPGDFLVQSPVKRVQTADRIYEQGERVQSRCGAHVVLDVALTRCDIPSWQRAAYLEWKDSQRAEKEKKEKITRSTIDNMLGRGNWYNNRDLPFSAVVPQLQEDLPLRYPITSVDAANGLKYGVGMEPVRAGQEATVWVAGLIPPPNE